MMNHLHNAQFRPVLTIPCYISRMREMSAGRTRQLRAIMRA